jgi:hypothetical protein
MKEFSQYIKKKKVDQSDETARNEIAEHALGTELFRAESEKFSYIFHTNVSITQALPYRPVADPRAPRFLESFGREGCIIDVSLAVN